MQTGNGWKEYLGDRAFYRKMIQIAVPSPSSS